ncbi:MAG TPA: redoxin domain-containing protein [Longimicrobium sp.]|jgi:peroxiredoxin
MDNQHEQELKLGARRLPDLRLPSAPAGAPTPLRPPGRVSPVLVLVHGAGCEGCRAWLRRLAASSDGIAEWDGRVVILVPESPDSAAAMREDGFESFTILADPDRTLAARLGTSGAAVVIADQYGVIHEAADAGEGHDFPEPHEVVNWLQYLAVQCPECQGEAL